jgi:hypothetical protein
MSRYTFQAHHPSKPSSTAEPYAYGHDHARPSYSTPSPRSSPHPPFCSHACSTSSLAHAVDPRYIGVYSSDGSCSPASVRAYSPSSTYSSPSPPASNFKVEDSPSPRPSLLTQPISRTKPAPTSGKRGPEVNPSPRPKMKDMMNVMRLDPFVRFGHDQEGIVYPGKPDRAGPHERAPEEFSWALQGYSKQDVRRKPSSSIQGSRQLSPEAKKADISYWAAQNANRTFSFTLPYFPSSISLSGSHYTSHRSSMQTVSFR